MMMPNPVSIQAPTARPHLPWRWIVLGTVSLLLHILAIDYAREDLPLPALETQHHAIVTATLHMPPPLAKPATPQPVTKPTPRPRARRAPSAANAKVKVVAPSPLENAGLEAPSPSIESATPLAQPDAPVATQETPPSAADTPPPQIHYQVRPPPSVELRYDVTKVPREGRAIYGQGSIVWQAQNNHYRITGQASVLFITALTFRSEGTLDEFGIAPEIYSEKRFRKSETNTHFHRERNIISFSASERQYPRQGGEQDRASIVWQLASIGRGDRAVFADNAQIDIFVAGVRDAEVWRIRVLGQESIDVGAQKVPVWHLVRAPRPGSYDQQLDIWLAPQYEWYPVKLRFTETNADYLDMSLSNLPVAAIH